MLRTKSAGDDSVLDVVLRGYTPLSMGKRPLFHESGSTTIPSAIFREKVLATAAAGATV
jgi:hypothetical protein